MSRKVHLLAGALALFSFLYLAGCGYVWKPLNECAAQRDCPSSQLCVRGICKTRTTGGACRTNADCGDGLCVAQRCTPAGPQESTTPDGGPLEQGGMDGGDVDAIVPGPDRLLPGDKGTQDGGPVDDVVPEPTPDTTPNVTHRSSQGPLTGCLAGATRSCKYKASTSDARACGNGLQKCLFNGNWSDCASGNGGGIVPTGWFTPSEKKGEICWDDKDNNCNGAIDEGCFREFLNRCQSIHRLRHSSSREDALLVPALLSHLPYSPVRKLLLKRSPTRGVMSLFGIEQRRSPKDRWLLDMPAIGDYANTYDLSRDGKYVAVSTGKQVVVWQLKYDAKGLPSVSRYGVFPVPNVRLLGFRNVAGTDDLVMYQQEYVDKKYINTFVSWRLQQDKAGHLTLSLVSRVRPPEKRPDQYAFHDQSRLGISPKGDYAVFYSYRRILIYRLPGMSLLKNIDVGAPADPESRKIAFHPTRPFFVIAPFNYGQYALSIDMSLDANGQPKGTQHKMYEWPQGDAVGLGFEQTSGELVAFKDGLGLLKWNDIDTTQQAKASAIGGTGFSYAMTSDGAYLFVGGQAGWIRVLSSDDGKEVYRWQVGKIAPFQYDFAYMMRLSSDQKTLFVLTSQSAAVWEIERRGGVFSAKKKQELITGFKRDSRKRYYAQFSYNNQWFSLSIDSVIHLWKADAQGRFKKEVNFTAHKGRVSSMAFHRAGSHLLSGDDKGQLYLWPLGSVGTARLLHTFTNEKNTYPLKVVGVNFFETGQTAQDTYLQATDQEGTTHFFSFQTTAQGDLRTSKLPGLLKAPDKRGVAAAVYQSKSFVLLRYANNTVSRVGFHFSVPDAKGLRSFSAASTETLELPKGTHSISIAEVFPFEIRREIHVITRSYLYRWRCHR